ncbi:hypothetical protein EVAR_36276_1 [Eumeta japonica]|uniref:Uncharacterized protein n=1 Tax=Eumeta variegata TaxID=151549 RepID=A0A4C1VKC8_EUMVA|nr:hypothetical protein EVAR_36276_1 [Eumeta japonica]
MEDVAYLDCSKYDIALVTAYVVTRNTYSQLKAPDHLQETKRQHESKKTEPLFDILSKHLLFIPGLVDKPRATQPGGAKREDEQRRMQRPVYERLRLLGPTPPAAPAWPRAPWPPVDRTTPYHLHSLSPNAQTMGCNGDMLAMKKDKSFVSLYHEPHSTDVLFGCRRRRTYFTQIVGEISAITFEVSKPVINSDNGGSFIMKG